ncbi:hypothetical protein IMZ48_36635, partial [Candidatus Bathyarchaeota archaeon]|nr:hypothetical protein [Candidatus Bathyarchaeota archaeon]
MDRIPLELQDRIISYVLADIRKNSNPYVRVPVFRLAPLAALTRTWQRSIERRTFRTLSITNEDLEDFDRIVTWRHRYVRKLHFTVKFPYYDDELSKEYETNEERVANNAIATSAVKQLFAILSAWGSGEDLELELQLSFTSPGDKVKMAEGAWPSWRGIDDKRYQYSYVRLDGVEGFDKVNRVTQYTQRRGTRPFDLRSQYDLTSRLPRAVLAIWDTIEAGPFVPSRQELRDRFVFAIESGSDCDLPPNLHLHITVEAPNFRHNQSLPNFTAPHTTYDRVSSALRQLSVRAVKFEFSGIADHTLLWPSPSQVQIQEPYWASLTCLEIELSLQSPSGKWYFRGKDSNRPGDVPIPDDAEAFFAPGYYEDDDVEYIDHNQEA